MSKEQTIRKRDALDYHEFPTPGKFEIRPTKPLSSQRDLSLAYSPGVAQPCLEIADDADNAYRYTNRGNLVAVISNGTATLGLGNIGALACKPVMEGKAILFKHLAGLDAVDVELDTNDTEVFIQCVKAMEPTFGGVNLEDIAAPECFEIEERLRTLMDIPVFHDDQHGTAIISCAALINAAILQEKALEELRVVFSGAGAAAIACARLMHQMGVRKENITLCDIDGVITTERIETIDPYRAMFAQETPHRTLADVLPGADVLVGLSVGGVVSQEMVATMAERPIVFALANPDPEISYPDVMEVRPDAIMATGRSDFPNQVNNVLGFPYLFRGALDVGAREINEKMKIAAVRAIADLAREDVPETVLQAYGEQRLSFGKEYIIPKPFDPRVLLQVAPAVAEAATMSGVARRPLTDVEQYRERLERTQGASKGMMRLLMNKAKREPQRILFPEGDQAKILHAAQILLDEQIALPVLMGNEKKIRTLADELDLELEGAEIFDTAVDDRADEMVELLYRRRQRRGVSRTEATALAKHRESYAMVMLASGRADGVVTGLTKNYSESLRPALEIVGTQEPISRALGVYVVFTNSGLKFFADTTVNIDPDADALAHIATHTADFARSFDVRPKIAMLSYSNFGQSRHPKAQKVADATRLIKARRPDLIVDGEMQVNPALDVELRASTFDFSTLAGEANVLVFPDLDAGNISYKLLSHLGDAEVVGPILLGMNRPVNVLQRGSSVAAIVNLTVITAIQSQRRVVIDHPEANP